MFKTFLAVAVGLIGQAALQAAEPDLPSSPAPAPVALPHFPDRVHAFVWRNWQAVEPGKIADVLGASVENVNELARSMGLPPARPVPPELKTRGYVTLIRRNWHLLPYEQLLQLLDMTPRKLAFILREDDFLWIKLGNLKPKCEMLRYRPPDEAARRRAAEIRQIVEAEFGKDFSTGTGGEERFGFLKRMGGPAAPAAPAVPPAPAAADDQPLGLRYIYSYAGVYGDPLLEGNIDSFPDDVLRRLAGLGVNGVWMHVVLRDLAPGGKTFPQWGASCERRLANLRQVVQRAARHGIGVYLYMNEPRAMPRAFFKDRPQLAGVWEGEYGSLCTSQPAVREWITNSLAYVFTQVPHLGGVFTITASENLTNCASHGAWRNCPRCKGRGDSEIIAEVNAAVEAGVHQGNPKAKVICWDWGWKGHGEAPETIARLPRSVWLMSVSEWSLPIERGGVKGRIGEYSMSVVGPGPRATKQWASARQAGLKTVAKVQVNCTWELSAVPYLPVMDIVAEHLHNLAEVGVDGLMLSWTLGGYPSPNLEIAGRLARRPVPAVNEVLDAVARGRYGPDGAPHARKAWTAFSRALAEYPYDGGVLYTCPVQLGPANLLHARPTGFHATMVGLPYDDLRSWRGPYPPEVFIAQFEKVAAGWQSALADLQTAVEKSPPDKRAENLADWRLARAAYLHFQSVANQSRFTHARDRLLAAGPGAASPGAKPPAAPVPAAPKPAAPALTAEERTRLAEEMRKCIASEIALARELYTLTSLDSRIGFEASNHYYYLPLDLVEKVVSCK